MLSSLEITKFRAFSRFEFPRLSPVNLFVGRNNSGKTCALEAIHCLASGGNPEALLSSMWRRGEILQEEDTDPERRDVSLDVGFLFHDHVIAERAFFQVRGDNIVRDEVKCEVAKITPEETKTLFETENVLPEQIVLRVSSKRLGRTSVLPLSRDGGISYDRLRRRMFEGSDKVPISFVTPESLVASSMARLWDAIALTPAEEDVLEALRILDARVERMTFVGIEPSRFGPRRTAIVLKLRELDYRVPLGSMGDGMRRILALSMSANRCQDGVLLVDEIDTGLHYTVMADMWRMLVRTAKRNRAQVFATTHSQDCVNALAWVCEKEPDLAGDISLHRIEVGTDHAVTYSAEELAEAARRHIEVR